MPPSRFKCGRGAAAPSFRAGVSCKRPHSRWRRQSTMRRGAAAPRTVLPVLPHVIPGHRDRWPLAWLALLPEEQHPVSSRPPDPLPVCQTRRPGVRDPEPSTCPGRAWTEQSLWPGSRHLPPPCRLCRRHRSQCPELAADPPSPPLRMSWYGYETVGAQKGSRPHRICRCLGFRADSWCKAPSISVLLIFELPGILRRVASPKARSGSVTPALLRFS